MPLTDAQEIELETLSDQAITALGPRPDPDNVFWTSLDGHCIIFEEPPQLRSVYFHDKLQYEEADRYNVVVPFPWSYYIAFKKFGIAELWTVWSQVPLRNLDSMTYHTLLTNVKEDTHFCADSVPTNPWTYASVQTAVSHTMASSFNGASYQHSLGKLPNWAERWVKPYQHANPNGWDGWINGEHFYNRWEATAIKDILHKELMPHKTMRDMVQGYDDPMQCLRRLQAAAPKKLVKDEVPF